MLLCISHSSILTSARYIYLSSLIISTLISTIFLSRYSAESTQVRDPIIESPAANKGWRSLACYGDLGLVNMADIALDLYHCLKAL